MAGMIIGIDFDNTIINYDTLFYDLATGQGWLHPSVDAIKKEVRDHVRTLNNGEGKWQILQAMAYGEHIHEAQLESGFIAFLHWCEARRIPYYIISHKTPFATACPDGLNLQDCAGVWLQTHVFNSKNKIIGSMGRVFFEPTRALKIARLNALGCSHFIDDLEEMFSDPSFPKGVKTILFGDGNSSSARFVCGSWLEIQKLFGGFYG